VFVVSVLDDGDERNFVATDLRMVCDDVLINASGVQHLFRLKDVIDIVPVGEKPSAIPKSPAYRSRLVS
jgi:hypothetical protein